MAKRRNYPTTEQIVTGIQSNLSAASVALRQGDADAVEALLSAAYKWSEFLPVPVDNTYANLGNTIYGSH